MESGSKRATRRVWTNAEEVKLLEALKELRSTGWKCDNGIFRAGYIFVLEKSMMDAFPKTDLRAVPHIESKIKVWKKHHRSLLTMMRTSGFDFNETDMKIEVEGDEIWNGYIKKDKGAKNMRKKSWPYYHDWCLIFGKDRASDEHDEDLMDRNEELEGEEATAVANYNVAQVGDTVVSHSVTQNPSGNTETNQERKQKRRKSSGSDARPSDVGEMAKALSDYMVYIGQKLDNIAQRIGYAHDASEARRRVYGELEKMKGLGMHERLDIGMKIVSDPFKVDFFFSLPEHARSVWVRYLMRSDI